MWLFNANNDWIFERKMKKGKKEKENAKKNRK